MDLFNRFSNIAGSYLIIFRFEEFLRDFKEDFISMGMSLLSRWFEFHVRFESVVIRVTLLVSKLCRSVFDLRMSIESCVKAAQKATFRSNATSKSIFFHSLHPII